MPEGDTVYRAARTLHRALAGHEVTTFESVLPKLTRVHEDTPITGRRVESVTSRGKHLLIALSGDLVLRTHLRMNGSWHIYRHGERWQRPRRDMRIVIGTDRYVAVGFSIPVAEWLRGSALERSRELRQLGPDLLAVRFDEREAVRRIRGRAMMAIGDVLLDQRVIAGVGNVYKSEVLFACRVPPFAEVRALSDEQVTCVVATARRFLQVNVNGAVAGIRTYLGFRKTTRRDDPAHRLWVYGRSGQPCRRCGSPIASDTSRRNARLTYWCPGCQR